MKAMHNISLDVYSSGHVFLTVKKTQLCTTEKKNLRGSSIIQRANDLNADSCGAFDSVICQLLHQLHLFSVELHNNNCTALSRCLMSSVVLFWSAVSRLIKSPGCQIQALFVQ